MTTIDIRPARPDEAEACERILRAGFADYIARLGRRMSQETHWRVAEAIAEGRVLLAGDGDTPCAITMHADTDSTRLIERIAVDPAHRKSGVGTALLQAMERAARRDGIQTLELQTAEVMAHLVKWYGAHGFHIVRCGPPAHGRDAYTRVLMRKDLTGPG